MNRLIYKDGLQQLLTRNRNRYVTRLVPSVLLINIRDVNFIPQFTVGNKNKTSSIEKFTLYHCVPSSDHKYGSQIHFLEPPQEEIMKLFLDISFINYPFRWIKPRFEAYENVEEIKKELEEVCKEYNIKNNMDGYLLENGNYIIFK